MISRQPRSIELPISLSVGAVNEGNECDRELCVAIATLFQVLTQVDDFARHGWNQDEGDFLLGVIISAHAENKLCFVGCCGCTENR